MLKFLTHSPSPILGIDVTASAVKILEISGAKGQFCVERYGCEFIPPSVFDGQEILDLDAVAHSIKKLIHSCHFSSKKVALAVSDAAVITRMLSLPRDLNDEEMEALIMIEAEKFIPYPLSEIHLDFSVQGLSANNSNCCDVLVVASRSELIHNRLECLNRAGLDVQIIDVESFAVERIGHLLSQELSQDMQTKPIAILDVGIHSMHLFVLQEQRLVFSREEKLGENQFVQATAGFLSMDEAQAINKQNQTEPQLIELFEHRVLLQIKRTLQFYYSMSQDEPIEYVFLAGELAKISGLKARIQAELDLPCQVINPFSNMSIHPRVDQQALNQDAPSLLVACGLTLREAWGRN